MRDFDLDKLDKKYDCIFYGVNNILNDLNG